MDHPCEKCGAVVEDGRPFCQQCRAPQIHVQVAVQSGETAAAVNDAQGERSARVSEAGEVDPLSVLEPALSDRGRAGRVALKAGLLGAVLGIISPAIGVVLAGTLAVFFYRRQKGLTPSIRIASRLGGAAGIVSFTVDYLLLVIEIFAMHAQREYTDKFLKVWETLGYSPTDPQVQASVRMLLAPSGLMLTFVFGIIFAVILAALGGAVAALFSRPGSRR